jgi:hypothetical protein
MALAGRSWPHILFTRAALLCSSGSELFQPGSSFTRTKPDRSSDIVECLSISTARREQLGLKQAVCNVCNVGVRNGWICP